MSSLTVLDLAAELRKPVTEMLTQLRDAGVAVASGESPISPADKLRPEYERGACCHHCAGEYSDADRQRFRERQRQMDLAEARGVPHFSD